MANLLPTSSIDGQESNEYEDKDRSDAPAQIERNGGNTLVPTRTDKPFLFHKIQNQTSILALLISDSKIYAGTQSGDLLVRYLCAPTSVSNILTDPGVVLRNVRASFECPCPQKQCPLPQFVAR